MLATAATVIASQALISGAFSLTQQAVQLGYLPRLKIVHTSKAVEGQIYMPFVTIALALACLALVLAFRSSDRLGSAYGLAVTMTMLADSIAIGWVLRRRWKWAVAAIVPLVALFIAIDGAFLIGNLPKLLEGGYVPLGIALVDLHPVHDLGRRPAPAGARAGRALDPDRRLRAPRSATSRPATSTRPRSSSPRTPTASRSSCATTGSSRACCTRRSCC